MWVTPYGGQRTRGSTRGSAQEALWHQLPPLCHHICMLPCWLRLAHHGHSPGRTPALRVPPVCPPCALRVPSVCPPCAPRVPSMCPPCALPSPMGSLRATPAVLRGSAGGGVHGVGGMGVQLRRDAGRGGDGGAVANCNTGELLHQQHDAWGMMHGAWGMGHVVRSFCATSSQPVAATTMSAWEGHRLPPAQHDVSMGRLPPAQHATGITASNAIAAITAIATTTIPPHSCTLNISPCQSPHRHQPALA